MSKNKTLKGLIFKFLEKSMAQVINFVISIVLARLLAPDAYGVIALVTILITFADVFVTYGFGNSLVVKKEATSVDYSSCLYVSLLFSVAVYTLLYVAAPALEGWFGYEEYNLSLILRVMGLRLPLAAFNSIQQAYVSKHFLFNKSFWAGVAAALVSGVAGVALAYFGFGVWALVAQYLLQCVVMTVVTFFLIAWRPTREFSIACVKESFSFGWKILLTGFFDTLYNEIRSLLISKKYSSADLAYYNRADSFPKIVIHNINVSIISVLFPSLAEQNGDKEKVKAGARMSLGACSFLLFPLLVGLAAVSKSMIQVLLTEKWLESAGYVTILSIGYLFLPINSINKNIMKAMKRSDILLTTDVIKKVIGILLLILTMDYGVMWIAIGFALYNFLAVIVNVIPISKLLGYGFAEQIQDVLPNLLMSLAMGAVVYLFYYLPVSPLVCLLLQVLCGALVYAVMAIITKNKYWVYCLSIVKKGRKTR